MGDSRDQTLLAHPSGGAAPVSECCAGAAPPARGYGFDLCTRYPEVRTGSFLESAEDFLAERNRALHCSDHNVQQNADRGQRASAVTEDTHFFTHIHI